MRSDGRRGSQRPEQKPVVTEAHATLTELVKLPELVCLSDSSVTFISCGCSANLPQGNPGQKFIRQRFHCCEAFDDVGFACCLAKALSPLHLLQPLLQVVLGHSKMRAEVLTCYAFGPACPYNLS